MRKLIVLTFVTLDGVMQAPGGPKEDTDGGFEFGGWTVPFFDDQAGEEMSVQMGHDFDLLLGRRTFEIFAGYWPLQESGKDPITDGINKARKYVVSTTLTRSDWKDSFFINKNVPEEIRRLKNLPGPEIQVHGNASLLQTLWKSDVIDELWLKIFPVVVGSGKRLFEENDFAQSFELLSSRSTPSGVIIANYRRAGDVKTGSF